MNIVPATLPTSQTKSHKQKPSNLLILPFNHSQELSIGMELELQIIDPHTYDLAAKAKDLIRNIRYSHYKNQIKPEITQSMIEVNSLIHTTPQGILEQLSEVCGFLTHQAHQLDTAVCGGGTHPFQNWSLRKIFPTPRFRDVSKQYGYLAKRFTVFALHIHVGCQLEEDAIYLTHMLSRYIPQLIVLSASSPFYQGTATGFESTRVNVVSAFPLSGVMPFVTSWKEFIEFYQTMFNLKIVTSMKDFYWDIRPKPEFGTVEIRICDMPLTLSKAVTLTAYVQTLARYLLLERRANLTSDLYLVYNYNRFQASRYGYEGDIIDPFTKLHIPLYQDILNTIELLGEHADTLGTTKHLNKINEWTNKRCNDATYLKKLFARNKNLPSLVKKQCHLWMADGASNMADGASN